ncbi:ABC transporter ATP-binding protein [Salinibacillus xinjiangensis]|uniref:ATP-binding cassette domain-containing protein n=1 Tax=Salinibacillus xinjiangensis TaxID=1229268 RepID=A0A6G1X733_9BACI|nr:ABC transporter ATP-binding protein [Salinibacillus xinjiangensis]MRG86813.1 ATP-binding cassette domain-containing protein [Salinibacillus xinjiangensis]
MEPVLELKNLTKRLGNNNAVDDLSFTVNPGEVFGLLGPNGAGKTTTIRMIVGLISKTKGDVLINGTNMYEDFKKAMSDVGAIVENPEMYKFLSGYQNLLHFARMSQTEISKERINEVVKQVELEESIHKKVKTYSLGMRQRLGVAQAILHRPSLLILDEPTNGLDPQGIRDFRDYLRNLTKEGIAVMVSSHLLSEMQQMCDRVAIIQEGKLINISTIDEFSNEPNEGTLVHFEVDDAEKAQNLLAEQGSKIVKGQLQVMTKKENIPAMNETLVQGGVKIYGITSKNQSLEDKFLQITKAGEK